MNKFELKGKMMHMMEYPSSKGKVVGFYLDVEDAKKRTTLPIITFNKIAEIVLEKYKNGDYVEISGHIQTTNKPNAKNPVQLVVHYIKLATETEEINVELPKSNGVKQICLVEDKVINVYPTIRDAAKAVKVKKSALERAIEQKQVLGGYLWTL